MLLLIIVIYNNYTTSVPKNKDRISTFPKKIFDIKVERL